MADAARDPTLDQSGRALGPRALHTRQRLLDATAHLLEERGLQEASVVEIARKAGTSPATFYQYFKDVSDATLELARQAAGEMPALVERIAGSWRGRKGLDTARAVVDAFVRHWDAHRAVLLVRNLASDQGDRRFQRVRREALAAMWEQLAKRIEESLAEGRIAPGLNPTAAAAAMVSVLERFGAHHRGIEPHGVSRDELVETAARILYQTVTGRPAREG